MINEGGGRREMIFRRVSVLPKQNCSLVPNVTKMMKSLYPGFETYKAPPEPLERLHFKPWTKTFKSLQNKPFDLIF